MRTTLPLAVAFITGVVFVITFFLNEESPLVGGVSKQLLDWLIIIGGFTLLLGVVSILRVSWQSVERRKEDWIYKLITILSVLVMAIPGLLLKKRTHLACLLFTPLDWVENKLFA